MKQTCPPLSIYSLFCSLYMAYYKLCKQLTLCIYHVYLIIPLVFYAVLKNVIETGIMVEQNQAEQPTTIRRLLPGFRT